MKQIYEYVFEIEIPDKTKEQRNLEYKYVVIEALSKKIKKLEAENKSLKEEIKFMEWD